MMSAPCLVRGLISGLRQSLARSVTFGLKSSCLLENAAQKRLYCRHLLNYPNQLQTTQTQTRFLSKCFSPVQSNLLIQKTGPLMQPRRHIIKSSKNKGKMKTKRAVIGRFYRLRSGNWIRTYVGRHKKLWKRRNKWRWRMRQHIFLSSSQCKKLDKMVTAYWKKPRYYVDDIYEPYQPRTSPEFPHL